ncbi:set5 [Symbiodinium natans]|uniref:Set5 protein n=1 Tax=Symbiodinium natans TaxID=878477 RepID=A0A812K6E7_9DINO|nr:set5 [Symbiodinium natans]
MSQMWVPFIGPQSPGALRGQEISPRAPVALVLRALPRELSNVKASALAAAGAAAGTAAARHCVARRARRGQNLQNPFLSGGKTVCRATTAAPVEILPIPAKGFGAIATRDIARGELVLEERPTITYQAGSDWPTSLQQQFDRLPVSSQTAVMELCDATPDEKGLKGVFDTNSIGCSSPTLDGVLCLSVSRINHSCLPNCEQFWDEQMFREKIFACKDIQKGEELSISYVEPYLLAEERNDVFRRRYAFQCNCAACSSQSREASDRRRRRLGEMLAELGRGVSPDADAGVALAKELLQLCDEEGLALQGFRAQACYHAFQCLLLAGRGQDEAAPWLRRARESLEATRGAGDPDVEALRGYEADPLSHPAASDQATQLSGLAGPALAAAAAAAALYFFR